MPCAPRFPRKKMYLLGLFIVWVSTVSQKCPPYNGNNNSITINLQFSKITPNNKTLIITEMYQHNLMSLLEKQFTKNVKFNPEMSISILFDVHLIFK